MPVPPDLGLPLVYTGKIRDVYALSDDPVGAERLLMVTTDRLSACDQVLDALVPDKGRVLTALSAFWFDRLGAVLPGHVLSTEVDDLPRPQRILAEQFDLEGRIVIVRRAHMLPVECIVRRCLTGSAWREYRASGTVGGAHLRDELQHGDRLPRAMFTPTTKAAVGQHDTSLSRAELAHRLGPDLAAEVEVISLALFDLGAAWAKERGIVLADAKFELGFVGEELVLCDELLTPDSARFWPAGRDGWPATFDKQLVRDHLDREGWDGRLPAPRLPADVLEGTRLRYIQAYERLSGRSFADWPGVRAPMPVWVRSTRDPVVGGVEPVADIAGQMAGAAPTAL